jgi:hypothetical protein
VALFAAHYSFPRSPPREAHHGLVRGQRGGGQGAARGGQGGQGGGELTGASSVGVVTAKFAARRKIYGRTLAYFAAAAATLDSDLLRKILARARNYARNPTQLTAAERGVERMMWTIAKTIR